MNFTSVCHWLSRLIPRRRSYSGHTGQGTPAVDRERNLDPYCSEAALQQRQQDVTLTPGEARAIRKIGGRYGAEL